jgi:F-type H+-transporting ATPase subunit alpha
MKNISVESSSKTKVSYVREKLIEPGVVVSISDGIAIVENLQRARVSEVVSFLDEECNIIGLVMDLDNTSIKVAMLTGDKDSIRTLDKVYLTRMRVRTRVGLGTIGRVSNPLGVCLNDEDYTLPELTMTEAWNLRWKDIDSPSPSIIEREPVRSPVHTGINAIDVMLPIGCGQRELIIGDLGSGKTTLALTIVLHQNYKNRVLYKQWRLLETNHITYRHRLFIPCIYVVIGGKRSEIFRIKSFMKNTNMKYYTSIVFTGADELASLQYVAPFAGCAIGEWFRDSGYRSIIVYDELYNHAASYRQMSLLLRRPPAREAFPGDIFYLHARLLERSAQMHRNLGGGSLTALPIVETKGGDISAYIPTNIISITDGQVFLNMKLFNSGIKPAIDLNLSVSRIGSDAQYNIMKFISKKVKLAYGIYRNLQGVEKLSGSLDSYILSLINRGKRIVEFFKQDVFHAEHLYKQILVLYAIVENLMEKVKPEYTLFYFTLMFRVELADNFLLKKNRKLLFFITNDDVWNTLFMTMEGDVIKKYFNVFINSFNRKFNTSYNGKVYGYVKSKL